VSKHNDADTHQLCVFGNDLRSRRGFARVNLEHSIVSREDDGEQATERISFRS
jgi:sporulation protein YlmC with PRC-barrel domain